MAGPRREEYLLELLGLGGGDGDPTVELKANESDEYLRVENASGYIDMGANSDGVAYFGTGENGFVFENNGAANFQVFSNTARPVIELLYDKTTVHYAGDGETMGQIGWAGHNGTSGFDIAGLACVSTEDHDASGHGVELSIYTTINRATVKSIRWLIDSAGNSIIGAASSGDLATAGLQVGSFANEIYHITAAYTVDTNQQDHTILCDIAARTYTLTLPDPAATYLGRMLVVKAVGITGAPGTLTLACSGAAMYFYASVPVNTLTLTAYGETYILQCGYNGSAYYWYVWGSVKR